MKRLLVVVLVAIAGFLAWRLSGRAVPPENTRVAAPAIPVPSAAAPTAAEKLLEGYGDPATPPAEDLKRIHRVTAGYFSVIKDSSKHPIGGNADLAAALRGENPNREVFVNAGHPVFSAEGLLIDRWGSPLVVHPEAWKQLELRSAGPDQTAYTGDDVILAPNGTTR